MSSQTVPFGMAVPPPTPYRLPSASDALVEQAVSAVEIEDVRFGPDPSRCHRRFELKQIATLFTNAWRKRGG
jgi:hypothetical protein